MYMSKGKRLRIGLCLLGLCILSDAWRVLANSGGGGEPPEVACPQRFRVVSETYRGKVFAKLMAGDVFLFTGAEGLKPRLEEGTCPLPCTLKIDLAGPGLQLITGMSLAKFMETRALDLAGKCIAVQQSVASLFSDSACVTEQTILQITAAQNLRFNATGTEFSAEIEMRQIVPR